MKTIQEEEEEEKTLRTIEMLDIRNVYRTPQETILCSVSNPQSILFFLYILFFAHTFLSKGWREHQPSFCFSLMLSDTCAGGGGGGALSEVNNFDLLVVV